MAAACGSLLPENSTALLETTFSSSWGQIMALKQTEQHATFTQIFGEQQQLHFKGDHHIPRKEASSGGGERRRSYSFSSSSNSESLQLCTEGLGYESLDDVEDLEGESWQSDKEDDDRHHDRDEKKQVRNLKIMRTKSANVDDFPPPISCMGKTGKPWAGFKSYRYGGRFILKEVRVPTHEFLHASRENGRLKLHILVPNHDQTRSEAAKEHEDDDNDNNHHPDDNSIHKCCRVQTSST